MSTLFSWFTGSSAKDSSERKTVAIVGGGYAGTSVAQGLSKTGQFNICVIDQKNCLVHSIAWLRACTTIDYAKNIIVPRDKCFADDTSCVHSAVTKVTHTQIFEENGESLKFDYLVLATGARNAFPSHAYMKLTKHDDIFEFFNTIAKKINDKNIKKIVIIGGGAVGVEFAGELSAIRNGELDVTLIHSGTTLCNPDFTDGFHKDLTKKLEGQGVRVICGWSAERPAAYSEAKEAETGFLDEPAKIKITKLDDGKPIDGKEVLELDADLTFFCTGIEPNTSLFKENFSKSMDERGYLRTNHHGQIFKDFEASENNDDAPVYDNIFALGDCAQSTIGEAKMYFIARETSKSIVANITHHEKHGKMSKKVPTFPNIMIVPIGPKLGTMHTPLGSITHGMLGDMMTRSFKSKYLALDMVWKDHGHASPTAKKKLSVDTGDDHPDHHLEPSEHVNEESYNSPKVKRRFSQTHIHDIHPEKIQTE
eukprot:g2313.t1